MARKRTSLAASAGGASAAFVDQPRFLASGTAEAGLRRCDEDGLCGALPQAARKLTTTATTRGPSHARGVVRRIAAGIGRFPCQDRRDEVIKSMGCVEHLRKSAS